MSLTRRHFAALLACVSLFLISSLPPEATGGAAPDCRVYLGAWVGEQVNIPGDWDAFEQAIGKKLSIIHRYACNPPYYSARFDVDWANSVRARGAIPMLSWDPDFGSGGVTLATIAAGARDDFTATWADQLRDWEHPIFLRMMWEQNAFWYAWRADSESKAADFIAAWQRIVSIFRSRGANNVTFVWSPNVSGISTKPIMETYPGDEYVDWVALDGYPYRGSYGSFYDTFKPDYDLLTSRVNKPLMIAETSLEQWSDQIKSDRITDILTNQLPNNFPLAKALVWFDEKNTDGINFSILTAQGPLSRQAFRQGVIFDYYASNYFGTLNLSPIPIPEVAILNVTLPTPTPDTSIPPISAISENLLINPGFEIETATGLPQGWTVSNYPSCVSVDSIKAYSGHRSLKHESGKGESYLVYQESAAIAGKSYSCYGWVNVSATSGFFNFGLLLQPITSNNGVIKTIPLASFRSVTNGWQNVRFSNIVMPSGTARVRVLMKVDSLKATINVDDLILVPAGVQPSDHNGLIATATVTPTIGQPPSTATSTQTPTASPTPSATATTVPIQNTPTATATPTTLPGPSAENLLANPSFIGYQASSGMPEAWNVSSWAASKVQVGQEAFDGDGCGLVQSSDGLSYVVFQEVTALPGKKYSLTGWVKPTDLIKGAYRIEMAPMNRYGGPVGTAVSQSYIAPSEFWQRFRLDLVLPSNAVKVRVQFKSDSLRGKVFTDALELTTVP